MGDLGVVVAGERLGHRLYHFRLAFSGWEHVHVNGGLKIAENQRFEIAPRPHLAVDLMVANNGWTAYPVEAVSRRRRGPKARLYRVCRLAKLRQQVERGQLPSAMQLGNFKPLVFGAFRAAANSSSMIVYQHHGSRT